MRLNMQIRRELANTLAIKIRNKMAEPALDAAKAYNNELTRQMKEVYPEAERKLAKKAITQLRIASTAITKLTFSRENGSKENVEFITRLQPLLHGRLAYERATHNSGIGLPPITISCDTFEWPHSGVKHPGGMVNDENYARLRKLRRAFDAEVEKMQKLINEMATVVEFSVTDTKLIEALPEVEPLLPKDSNSALPVAMVSSELRDVFKAA